MKEVLTAAGCGRETETTAFGGEGDKKEMRTVKETRKKEKRGKIIEEIKRKKENKNEDIIVILTIFNNQEKLFCHMAHQNILSSTSRATSRAKAKKVASLVKLNYTKHAHIVLDIWRPTDNLIFLNDKLR